MPVNSIGAPRGRKEPAAKVRICPKCEGPLTRKTETSTCWYCLKCKAATARRKQEQLTGIIEVPEGLPNCAPWNLASFRNALRTAANYYPVRIAGNFFIVNLLGSGNKGMYAGKYGAIHQIDKVVADFVLENGQWVGILSGDDTVYVIPTEYYFMADRIRQDV